VLITAAGGGSSIDGANAEKNVDHAEEVVVLLSRGNVDEVNAVFNEVMQEELLFSDLEASTPIINEAGECEGLDRASVEGRDDHFLVFLQAEYSENNLTFSVTYNQEDEIAGLYVQ